MDIERYLNQETVLARPPSRVYRLQKLVRRNRMVFLFGAAAAAALVLGTIVSTLMFLKEREARSAEARLRKEAEAREEASHILLLVTQRRFEEADRLAANVPLDKPSIEIAAELRALGDWHALNGRWPEAAARFQSLLKVNQLEDVDLMAADHLRLAAAFLKSGNRDGYEQFRQAQVARLGVTNIASEYWTFKIALLLPPDANMLQGVALGGEVVEKRFPSREEMRPNPPHGVQWAETLALLDYRRGRFSQALDWGYRYEKWAILTGARVTKMCLIKAMSNWQLGQYRTALVDWIEACELIQAKLEQGLDLGIGRSAVFPGIGAPEVLEGPWWDWVNAGLLMRECDEVFAQSEHMLDSRPEPDVVSGDSVTALARALGDWHAIRGEWEMARQRFEQVRQAASVKRAPADHLCSGMAAVKLGDETGFLRLRDEALHRFKDLTDNEDAAETVMKLSLLRPLGETPAGALAPFVQVLERTVARAGPIKKGTTTSVAWDLMLLGLLEYRRGNYSQAMEWCRRSLDTSTFMPLPTVMDRVILAMCFHKLGDAAAARSELGQAKSPVMGGMNRGFDKWHWHDWVFARLLLQEAEGLIPQPPLPAASAAPQ
jgi:tetratricopeptide (TPR) repeat protein